MWVVEAAPQEQGFRHRGGAVAGDAPGSASLALQPDGGATTSVGCEVTSPDDQFKKGIIAAIPRLRAYATGLLGSISDADDLVQDSLVRAWRSRQTFVPGTNLNAWMFRILRNVFLSQLPKRRQMVADIDGQMAARLTCAPVQEWHLQVSDVTAALPGLSVEHREAILLVLAAGHSYEEAAGICACGINAMKQRVRQARKRLADLIDPPSPPAWSRSRSSPTLAEHRSLHGRHLAGPDHAVTARGV